MKPKSAIGAPVMNMTGAAQTPQRFMDPTIASRRSSVVMKAATTVTEGEKTATATDAPSVSGAAVDQRLLDEDYMSSEMDKGKITKLSLYDAE